MKNPACIRIGGAALLALAFAAAAQQPIVYPAKGQSPQQQQKDQGECQVWATQSTGIDPAELAQTPVPQQQSSVGGGERVQGAARGALGGLAIGAIAGDAGQGAAIGAVAGNFPTMAEACKAAAEDGLQNSRKTIEQHD
ncbi:MAG: hypothetical protein ACRD3M_04195, partial [Thermoanaerobaculia bacterium]